ncbi:heparin lyase I family protein [Qipengyuania sphaerica]|uniref:heparin lyase I family protein n=1 Tax=Qipengyuania sphaerica TaxID=2867243 RepID=UPI001C87452E|nr:heparin lyase I family protein [Qipengyuania sphaerica]MBX7539721.1 polysaccharide lyase [Qipengyuania sphaerica]
MNRRIGILLVLLLALLAANLFLLATPTNHSRLSVGGSEFTVHAPERRGAITRWGANSFSFEIQDGDRWASAPESKGERAELSSQTYAQPGQSIELAYDLKIVEAGSMDGPARLILSQLHGPDRPTLPEGDDFIYPPFVVNLEGDKLLFTIRSGTIEAGRGPDLVVAEIPANRGEWQRLRYCVTLGTDAGAVIYQNGERAGQYLGPVGYDAGDQNHYWKLGTYRFDETGVTRADFRNISVRLKNSCDLQVPVAGQS